MSGSELVIALAVISAASAFGLVASVWLIGLGLWHLRQSARARQIETRLLFEERLNPANPKVLRLWRDGKNVTTTVPGVTFRETVRRRLEHLRRGLGWNVPLPTLILGPAGLSSLSFLVTIALTKNIMLALAVGCAPIVVGTIVMKRRVRTQNTLFETQFVDALALITRSLRAGHPLLGAFRLIVDEMTPPVSEIFAEIVQQQALGLGLDEAIRNTADRSPNPDMKLFAASTIIQLRSGGNLADMMDRLAVVVRDRIRLHRRAHILTAQNQLSKNVLVVIPFVLLLAVHLMSPGYLEPLYTTDAGRIMLLIGGLLLLLGVWVINRIIVLHY